MPILGNVGSPKELIIIWSGLLADIPKGWALCDGTNGTPDLLAMFVVSVASDAVEPGTLGGDDTKALTIAQLPIHAHTVSESGHTHDFTMPASNSGGSGGFLQGVPMGNTSSASANTSSESTGVSVTDTGSGNSIENRPVFFEIAYIQQIT